MTSVYNMGKHRNAAKADGGTCKDTSPTPSSHGGEQCDAVQDLMEEVVSTDGCISQGAF